MRNSHNIVYTIKNAKPAAVGRKAYNLFLLSKHFPVPEFCVVTADAYRTFKRSAQITPALKDELASALEQFLDKGPVAVRSSGTAEDMPGVSFAGMYSTTLSVTTVDEGLAAIVKTWKSTRSERVKKYCKAQGLECGEMAVIIQHQLAPEVSGVMVTQSPFSIQEVLIECCIGLGEKLVSGRVTPTRYRIRGEDMVEQKGKKLLSDKQMHELVDAGKRIEKLFGAAQDIEWTMEKGQLYILQSRPVSVESAEPRRRTTVWTNANVRETIPDPISPLGWSMFDGVFFPYIFTDVFDFPITREQYYKYRAVELLSGRLYWNVNNTMAFMRPVGRIIDFIKGGEAIDPQFAAAFDAVDEKSLPYVLSPFRMYTFTIVSSWRLLYFLILGFFRYRWMAKKIAKSHAAFDSSHDEFEPAHDLTAGLENTRKWFELILRRFTRKYFGGVFLSGFYLALLSIALSLRIGKRGEAIARKTTLGILDKTGEMVFAVSRLAELAARKLRKVTVPQLRRLYEKDETFRACFDRFIKDFGHRGPAEFDIASVNWRENHEMVYTLIKTAQSTATSDLNRTQLIHDLLKQSKPCERFLLKLFLPRIEAFTPFRENGKHIYFRLGAKIKDQLLVMARILQGRGFLRNERDIFFLTLPDIKGITGDQCTKEDILKRVRVREKQWHAYREAEAADIIYETGERIILSIVPSKILSGEALSYGKVTAKARIIKKFDDSHKLQQGEILVTHHTDPGWTPLFTICSGIIIEVGGLICHAAMVARELGVPAVVIRGATSLISEGTLIELDADEGTVRILDKAKGKGQNRKATE